MNTMVIDRLGAVPELLYSRLQEVQVDEEYAPAATPEESLALGVLTQAVYDLRRFHEPANALERELYRDACDWINDTDFTWPYSFVNICTLLDVPPETLRAEVLADASLGWLKYWGKIGGRFARCFGVSLAHTFQKHHEATARVVVGLHHREL